MTDSYSTLPGSGKNPDQPCPSWCTWSSRTDVLEGYDGFDYDAGLGLAIRSHETDLHRDGRFWAYVFAHEARYADGVRPIGDVRVAAGVNDEFDDALTAGLSPTEARQFAARLMDAADEAEGIAVARAKDA